MRGGVDCGRGAYMSYLWDAEALETEEAEVVSTASRVDSTMTKGARGGCRVIASVGSAPLRPAQGFGFREGVAAADGNDDGAYGGGDIAGASGGRGGYC